MRLMTGSQVAVDEIHELLAQFAIQWHTLKPPRHGTNGYVAGRVGMLRAIGLDQSGIRQMVRLESIVICLFGAVLGIGPGVASRFGVLQAINAQ